MPKLKKVIAGLALTTALAGGALATSATAASATTAPTGGGWAEPCNNFCNNFCNNCFQNNRCSDSDLDNVLWDLCVAGNCCNVCPEMDDCFN
jgi:hypothetical protein